MTHPKPLEANTSQTPESQESKALRAMESGHRPELVVVPAYGRDYHTREEAVADWLRGKDFQVQDPSSPFNGRYCSVRDPIDVIIRFDRRTKLTYCGGA